MRASERALEHIKYMNFCGLCTTGNCDKCEKLSAKNEAIKALEMKIDYEKKPKGHIYCENDNCDYETKVGTYEECAMEVSLDGGYVRSDKEGGQDDECPKCGECTLTWED